MPISKSIARFNRRVTNRLTRRVAAWLPGFGIVDHTGRRSGRPYRTPVNVFRRGDHYVIALTYGSDVDWVRNVVARGGCTLETRRRRVLLTDPRFVHDEQRRLVPAPVGLVLRLLGVADFMELSLAREGARAAARAVSSS